MSLQPELNRVQEQALAGLRPKQGLRTHIFNFYRTKPLGAFGATMALFILIVAIFAPAIRTHDPYITDHEKLYAAPSSEMYFGGDTLGRDVFSRIVTGARISIKVGLISALVGCALGMVIGVSSGYFGGLYDLAIQRLIGGPCDWGGPPAHNVSTHDSQRNGDLYRHVHILDGRCSYRRGFS